MKNPKTTIGGIATIVGAIAAIGLAYSKGTISSDMITQAFASIIAGIGLITAADSTTKGD